MKMIINNLLFALLLLSCGHNPNPNQSAKINESPIITNIEDSINDINSNQSQHIIDTMAILTNKNLTPLIKAFDNQELQEIEKYQSIPEFIRLYLEQITGKDFVIADKGEDWQATDVISENLPRRQLVYFGYNKDIALMAYYKGGVGKSECLLIFKLNDNAISDFWCGNVLANLKNKEEILNYIKENQFKKHRLNTNVIQL